MAVAAFPIRSRRRPAALGLRPASEDVEGTHRPHLGGYGDLHRRALPATRALAQSGRRPIGRGHAGSGGPGRPGAGGPGDSPWPEHHSGPAGTRVGTWVASNWSAGLSLPASPMTSWNGWRGSGRPPVCPGGFGAATPNRHPAGKRWRKGTNLASANLISLFRLAVGIGLLHVLLPAAEHQLETLIEPQGATITLGDIGPSSESQYDFAVRFSMRLSPEGP